MNRKSADSLAQKLESSISYIQKIKDNEFEKYTDLASTLLNEVKNGGLVEATTGTIPYF